MIRIRGFGDILHILLKFNLRSHRLKVAEGVEINESGNNRLGLEKMPSEFY